MLDPNILVELNPPTIYKLKADAPKVGISVEELYSDYETARHHYEEWKYDPRIMESNGHVSLVEMVASHLFPKPYRFEVSRDLGDHKW